VFKFKEPLEDDGLFYPTKRLGIVISMPGHAQSINSFLGHTAVHFLIRPKEDTWTSKAATDA
jgi:hypothetical protein